MKQKILITTAIALSLAAGWCGVIIEDPIVYTNTYMLLSALSSLFILVSVRLFVSGKYLTILMDGAVLLAFSEVLDEIFFNPVEFGVNDWLFLVFIAFWSVRRYYK